MQHSGKKSPFYMKCGFASRHLTKEKYSLLELETGKENNQKGNDVSVDT